MLSVGKMVKVRELSQAFRESGDKEISKLLKVPEDTVGSIIRKLKATGAVSTRHGRGRETKLSAVTARFLRTQVEEHTDYC